ncbi:MAG: hypothetical protein U0Q12_05990 [Vicinamibacterales bacterium]
MPKPRFEASIVLVSAIAFSACAQTHPRPLAADARARLDEIARRPASTGDQIYEGRVLTLDGRDQPLFAYERRVREEGGLVTSTHITHDPAGAVVVVQSASHTPAYELRRADLLHGQSGVSASVVIADGRATYTLDDGGRTTTAHETVREPVVAGPTMFGFILAHWEALARGAVIRFGCRARARRVARLRPRSCRRAGRADDRRMTPPNPLVRLAVSRTYFHFDTGTRQILEYTGRVPPFERRGDALAALDARVSYRFVAASFR